MAAKRILGWSLAIAGVLGAGPLLLDAASLRTRPRSTRFRRCHPSSGRHLIAVISSTTLTEANEPTCASCIGSSMPNDQGARLLGTMQDYCDWLKLIDSWQQDDLVHIADPLARAKRVSEIHTERQERVAGPPGENSEGPAAFRDRMILSEDQLSRMFDVLARRLNNVSEDDQKAIDTAKGLKRWGSR